jgi:hypothetical protein
MTPRKVAQRGRERARERKSEREKEYKRESERGNLNDNCFIGRIADY